MKDALHRVKTGWGITSLQRRRTELVHAPHRQQPEGLKTARRAFAAGRAMGGRGDGTADSFSSAPELKSKRESSVRGAAIQPKHENRRAVEAEIVIG
jgi:hypothetical protein